jgi:hypothetical protein
MNVSMRIITEDNVDQLYNMSYSKNAEVLNATENISKSRVPLVTEFKYPKSVATPSPIRSPRTPEDSPIRSPRTPEDSPRRRDDYDSLETPRVRTEPLPPYPNVMRPQEEGDAYEEIYRTQHPEEFDAEGNWIYAEETPEIEKSGPRKPTETPPPLEQEEPNITMGVNESPQMLTAVSKEPVLAQANPSPEFYIPSDIVDSPEKREAYLEMRRKEEEELKNKPQEIITSDNLSLLTDVQDNESEEKAEEELTGGNKTFMINN